MLCLWFKLEWSINSDYYFEVEKKLNTITFLLHRIFILTQKEVNQMWFLKHLS